MISQSEKTNPILSAVGGLQMNVNSLLQKDYENEPPSGPKKTNPIQTQFKASPEFTPRACPRFMLTCFSAGDLRSLACLSGVGGNIDVMDIPLV